MVRKLVIIERLTVMLGLIGFVIAWNIFAIYGMIRFFERIE
jgi:hypothetical protein